jgi:hypothetical protein
MNHVEFLKIASSGAEIVMFIKRQEDTMKLQQQLYISFLPYTSGDDNIKMLQNIYFSFFIYFSYFFLFFYIYIFFIFFWIFFSYFFITLTIIQLTIVL